MAATEDEIARIRAALASRSYDKREAAVAAAGRLGDAGEDLLEELVTRSKDKYVREWAYEHWRDHPGARSDRVLRELLVAQGQGSQELRWWAASELGRRYGADASDDLAVAFRQGSGVVRSMVIVPVARYADDRLWDEVLAWVGTQLKRQGRTGWSPPWLRDPLLYLMRHATADARRDQLVGLVRSHWNRLLTNEQEWVLTTWPDAAPGGAGPRGVGLPEVERLVLDTYGPPEPERDGGAR